MGVPAPLGRWSFLQGPRLMVHGLLDTEVTQRFPTPLFSRERCTINRVFMIYLSCEDEGIFSYLKSHTVGEIS